MPVRANIRVRGETPVGVCLSDSNFLISKVAPTPSQSSVIVGKYLNGHKDEPSSTGIERSRRTTLVKIKSTKLIDEITIDLLKRPFLLIHINTLTSIDCRSEVVTLIFKV
jgi:hypothetical protein